MLKLFDRSWIAMLMMSSAVIMPTPSLAQSVPNVIISEIAWAGSSISHSDEWIEITNQSQEAIDISGWALSGATNDTAITIPEHSILPAGQTYLISNYEHTHENTALATEPDLVTASLSLPNGGFHLHLYDNGGTSIDTAGGPGSPFAGQSGGTTEGNGIYKSMTRIIPANDGELASSWLDAQTSSNFTSTESNLGTPGTSATLQTEETADTPSETIMQENESPIRINELMTDPAEDQPEWIELINTSSEELDLTDWSIEDATGKQTVLSGALKPNQYLLVENPKGVLNNTGDSLILRNSNGDVINQMTYGSDEVPSPNKGAALAYTSEGTYSMTYHPTPAAVNIIDTTKPKEESRVESTLESTTPFIDVIISEFVSDPNEGGLEWIELHNRGTAAANLNGWTLEDERGTSTDLSNFTLSENTFLVVESPKGALNNNGDTIILKDHSGTMVEQLSYGTMELPAPMDGNALTRDADIFHLTQMPTPGKPNLVFIAVQPEELSPKEQPETNPVQISNDAPSTHSDTQTTVSPLVSTLRFETLYPNTVGSDEEQEYIEVKNTGTESINLNNWSIKDASGKTFTFNSEVLASGNTRIIPRSQSKIALNNQEEHLYLFAPNDQQIDEVSYAKASKGDLFTQTSAGWVWVKTVTETPTSTHAATPRPSTITQKSSNQKQIFSGTIKEVKTQTDGTTVRVTGTITAKAGTLGSQILYLQDASGGIQVYLHNGDFPAHAEGKNVTLNGRLSTNRQERRIKLTSAVDMHVHNTMGIHVKPQEVITADTAKVGSLVSTQGMVQSKTDTKLILEQSGENTTIYLKSNPPIDPNQFMRGDRVTITGILSQYNEQLRIRPRSQDDIQLTPRTDTNTAGVTADTPVPPRRTGGGYTLLIGTILTLLALAVWHYRPKQFMRPASI